MGLGEEVGCAKQDRQGSGQETDLGGALVCEGCHNKALQTGCLPQQKCIVARLLGLEGPGHGVLARSARYRFWDIGRVASFCGG